jgi:hypothetical protein
MHSVCTVAELHVTVTYIKILSVAQYCFYGKIMSPTTIRTSFLKINYIHSNLHSFHTLHINAALKQTHVRSRTSFCRRTISLHSSQRQESSCKIYQFCVSAKQDQEELITYNEEISINLLAPEFGI